MPIQNITFLDYEHLPKTGDYDEFLFIFSLVNASIIGSPEEQAQTSQVRVSVRISRSLQATWKLQSPNLEKILFEYAKRHLEERVSKGIPIADKLLDLNTSTVASICPFDPGRIAMSPGTSFEVEVKRNLGFRT